MRKRMMGLLFAGCLLMTGGISAQAETILMTEEEVDASLSQTVAEMLSGVDLAGTVVLGDYKSLILTKSVEKVTEEDIDAEVAYALSLNPVTLTEGTVQEKDNVTVSYYITCEGEDLYNGSSAETVLTIGEDDMGFDGFDEALTGTAIGETVTFTVEMPEDYSDLGGKSIDCEVKVSSISRSPSEATDLWVQENTSYDSVEEYREGIREELEAEAEAKALSSLSTAAWQAVLDSSEVLEYPETVLNYGKAIYQRYLESYASDADLEPEEYLEEKGISDEVYTEAAESYAESIAKQILVSNAIGEAEGFSTEDDAYAEIYEEYAESLGLTDEELAEQVGEDSIEQIILLDRISSLVVESAEITQ